MKLVDEKGKLFGKLNIIDLLALIVIVAALAFGASRVLRSDPAANPATGTTEITYTALVSGVDQATYDEVLRQLELAGGRDQLMANGEMVDAYITDVEAAPHAFYGVDAQGRSVYSLEDYPGGRFDLTFTVKANVASTVTNKVGTQEVRVGKTHILKTTRLEFPYSTIMQLEP